MARARRRRARFRENLHMPGSKPSPGPHLHFPRRRLVLRHRGVRAFVGDAIASKGEMTNPLCAQAIVFGNGFVETYVRTLDPRLQGAYHALARPVFERPLFAVRGWRRLFPVVAKRLDAVERRTRRVLRSMCRTYATCLSADRAAAVAHPVMHRRWFGHRSTKTRRSRLRRRYRNRSSKRRAEKRKRFFNYCP
ncbi:NF-kappa B inhibitor [Pseudocowpox virus]